MLSRLRSKFTSSGRRSRSKIERKQNYHVTKARGKKKENHCGATRRRFAVNHHYLPTHLSSTAMTYNYTNNVSVSHRPLFFSRFPKMLLRGTISAPLPSLRLKTSPLFVDGLIAETSSFLFVSGTKLVYRRLIWNVKIIACLALKIQKQLWSSFISLSCDLWV